MRNMWKIIMYSIHSNLIGKSYIFARMSLLFVLGKRVTAVSPRYQKQFFYIFLTFRFEGKGKNNFSRFGLTVAFSHDSFGTLLSTIHCKLTRQSDKTYKLINVINKWLLFNIHSERDRELVWLWLNLKN